jgi:hypothetical protein
MEIIEIVALIAAVLLLIKAIVNLAKPKLAIKRAEKILKNEALAIGLYIALAVITGYVVITAIGIVNAFVAVLFGASIVGLTLIMYPQEILKLTRKMLKDKKKMTFPMIVWVVLALWTLYALYVKYIGI